MAPETRALVVTPLAPHGGSSPPLVVPATSHVTLLVTVGFGGRRVEVDGQPTELEGARFEIDLEPVNATLVAFPDHEPYLTGLRRRGLIADSPRIVAHERRMLEDAAAESVPRPG
jgi:NAD+ kinase